MSCAQLTHSTRQLETVCVGGLQLGFFNIVGIPLFKAMAELFDDAHPLLDGVLANFKIWESAADEAAASTTPA